jgi:hypothetical protein
MLNDTFTLLCRVIKMIVIAMIVETNNAIMIIVVAMLMSLQ